MNYGEEYAPYMLKRALVKNHDAPDPFLLQLLIVVNRYLGIIG